MRESEVLREILIAVSARPRSLYYRNNSGVLPDRTGRHVKFGLKGSADILGCENGRAVAIEAKSRDGKQSVSQRRFQIAWEAAGGIYVLARSGAEAMVFLDLAVTQVDAAVGGFW